MSRNYVIEFLLSPKVKNHRGQLNYFSLFHFLFVTGHAKPFFVTYISQATKATKAQLHKQYPHPVNGFSVRKSLRSLKALLIDFFMFHRNQIPSHPKAKVTLPLLSLKYNLCPCLLMYFIQVQMSLRIVEIIFKNLYIGT